MANKTILSTSYNILDINYKILSTLNNNISDLSSKYLTIENPSGYGIFTFDGGINISTHILSAGDIQLNTSAITSAYNLLSGKIKELSSSTQELSSQHYYITEVELDSAVSAAVAKIHKPTALSDLVSAHIHPSDEITYKTNTLTYALNDIYQQLDGSSLSTKLNTMNNLINQLND